MHISATIARADASVSPTTSHVVGADFLPTFLQKAGKWIGRLGAEFEADRDRLEGLRQRLHEERCHLAVLGQFKRGKSTLVNALLGRRYCPRPWCR